MEVLVAILITTIILFFSYYGFALVKKNIASMMEELSHTSKTQALFTRLRSDLWLSKEASMKNRMLSFSVNGNNIDYEFNHSSIKRIQDARIDTVVISYHNLKLNGVSWKGSGIKDSVYAISFCTLICGDTIQVLLKRSSHN